MDKRNLEFFTIISAIVISIFTTITYNQMIIERINNQEIVYKYNVVCICPCNDVDTLSESELIIDDNWWTDYDLELLARAIYWEAGSNEIVDEHQQLVASVILNRVNDPRCPDTVYDVIMDDKYGIQYSTRNKIVSDNQPEIPQRCYDNALVVLNNEIDYPSDLIYQANFKQGIETYKIFETSYSTTYFCRG